MPLLLHLNVKKEGRNNDGQYHKAKIVVVLQ